MDIDLIKILNFDTDQSESINWVYESFLQLNAKEIRLLIDRGIIDDKILSISNNELIKVISHPNTFYYLTEYYENQNSRPIKSYLNKVLLDRSLIEIDDFKIDNSSNERIFDTKHPNGRSLELTKNRPLTSDELMKFISKLIQSKKVLQKNSKECLSFIQKNCYSIGVVRNLSFPNHFNSASSRNKIGRILLVNPDHEAITKNSIVSALIHESVHSFIYKLEHITPIYKYSNLDKEKIISPWTGNMLKSNTYMHACFVYFALNNFWSKTESIQGEIDNFISNIQVGFKSELFSENLEKIFSETNEVYKLGLKYIQNTICNGHTTSI